MSTYPPPIIPSPPPKKLGKRARDSDGEPELVDGLHRRETDRAPHVGINVDYSKPIPYPPSKEAVEAMRLRILQVCVRSRSSVHIQRLMTQCTARERTARRQEAEDRCRAASAGDAGCLRGILKDVRGGVGVGARARCEGRREAGQDADKESLRPVRAVFLTTAPL